MTPRIQPKLNVGHLVHSYLPRTQTFVYQYLKACIRTRPVIFSRERESLDEFPLVHPILWRRPFNPRRHRAFPGFLGALDPPYDLKVLHAHFGPVAYQALKDAHALGLPLITSFYGYDIGQIPQKPGWRDRYAELFDRGSAFLVEGPGMRSKLADLGCPYQKIHIQRIAIDISMYQYKERQLDSDSRIRILWAARMVEKKGLLDAIDAFANIAGEFPLVDLRVIGEGPLLEAAKNRVSALGIGRQVEFRGLISHQDLMEELKRCHILLAPSKTAKDGDTEGGAPTILLEAQAMGIPIVSTRHADIPYILEDNASGLLAKEGDVDGISRHLETLISDPKSRTAMGKVGRLNVEARHSVRKEIQSLERLYVDTTA